MKPDVGALEAVRLAPAARSGEQGAATHHPLVRRQRVAQHLAEVDSVADSMLARLDELTATLGTVCLRATTAGWLGALHACRDWPPGVTRRSAAMLRSSRQAQTLLLRPSRRAWRATLRTLTASGCGSTCVLLDPPTRAEAHFVGPAPASRMRYQTSRSLWQKWRPNWRRRRQHSSSASCVVVLRWSVRRRFTDASRHDLFVAGNNALRRARALYQSFFKYRQRVWTRRSKSTGAHASRQVSQRGPNSAAASCQMSSQQRFEGCV